MPRLARTVFPKVLHHLKTVVKVGVTPLSRMVQNLTFRYAQWINEEQRLTGNLFQDY